jgi:hypothetical protein
MLKTIIDLTNFINKVKYDANLFPNETKMNLLNAEYEFPKKYATFIEFLRKNNIDILK